MSYGIKCGCGNQIDLAGSRICSKCKHLEEVQKRTGKNFEENDHSKDPLEERPKTFAELGSVRHVQEINELLKQRGEDSKAKACAKYFTDAIQEGIDRRRREYEACGKTDAELKADFEKAKAEMLAAGYTVVHRDKEKDPSEATIANSVAATFEKSLKEDFDRRKKEWDERFEHYRQEGLRDFEKTLTEQCRGELLHGIGYTFVDPLPFPTEEQLNERFDALPDVMSTEKADDKLKKFAAARRSFDYQKYLAGEMKKTRFDLLPNVLPDIADVFAFGAGKYAAHGWRQIEDWDLVCFNKIMRHLTTWMFSKEKTDESGKSHLAHAAADLMIMLAREKDSGND